MRNNLLLIALVFVQLIPRSIFAQIEYVRSEDGNIREVRFSFSEKDLASGQVQEKVKTLDVRSLNPYKKLPFKIKKSEFEIKYDLSGLNISDLQENGLISSRERSKIENKTLHFTEAATYTHVREWPESTIITYDLNVFTTEGGFFARRSSGLVYNKKGKLIFEIPENKGGIIESAITENERYLVLKVEKYRLMEE